MIEERTVPFSEVASWQPGSVFMLDRRQEDPIDVHCEGLMVCRAVIASKDDRVVLRVEECVIEKGWPGDTPISQDG
ncbi:FliM/FliN family flagellar motor C-terminal domain-containing protein [Teichococcus aestuarii]|uniref:FliM/FliN family flagellar motor C-terminal domain-containing protein n=1 Tax=Teichococcus aestuarii TaxID=568898 RepID=UPI003613322B